MKNYLIVLLITSLSVTAQIKGVVKDSITGNPISYVNIGVENENSGTTSEENGAFTINFNIKNKKLIFSALGFEKKTIKIEGDNIEVKMTPRSYQLDEVIISKRFETRELEIGKTPNETYQAFDNGPRIDLKFFPYNSSYKKTKYLKRVSIFTDSKLENATIRIHFYSVEPNGFPGKELLEKDYIVTVKNGVKKNSFDLTDYNLRMPKNGLFVGFEKLIIERNKKDKTITDYNKNTSYIQTIYYPYVLYNRVEREFLYTFSGGKWNRQGDNTENKSSKKITVNEPAINLILTN